MDDHKYLLVEVDDLDLWIDSVARQMDCANDRFIHEGLKLSDADIELMKSKYTE